MATPRRSDNEGSEHQTYENVAFDSGPDNLNNNRYSINEIPQDYEENSKASYNGYEKCVMKVQSNISGFFKNYSREIGTFVKVILFLLYFAYFGYAIYYSFGDEGSVRLLTCTVIGLLLIILKISRQLLGQRLSDTPECCSRIASQSRLRLFIRWSLRIIVFSFLVVYVIVDVALDSPSNLTSVGGMMAYLVIMYLTSTNPAKVYWHPVFWGIALQYMFALLILRTYSGYEAFTWLGARVTEFLSFADEGAQFVFDKEYYTRHNFAFKIMPIVVYFCAVINILYYLGVMQFIVRHFGRFLSFCLNTTPAESVNAAANIFVSMIDAPLMIKPFLEDMTDSELHAVMTGGFATIAGGLFGAYTAFGVPANHLISASIMSAPAALAISKLTCPETETTIHSKRDFSKFAKSQEKNLIEAASAGATQSVKLVAAIMVNVMAFLSLLKFVNSTLAWFGGRIGVSNLSFQLICSYVLFPVSLFMGTEIADCRKVAELVGIKAFTNEFIAYDALSTLIHNKASFLNYTSQYNETEAWKWDGDDIVLTNWNNHVLVGGVLSDRSTVIATYALCGFSNFGSIGITLGVLGTLVPSKKRALSKLVMRAMIAGNLACFLTACIAGLLYKDYG